VAGQPARQTRQGALAASLPAGTVLQYDVHDTGSLIQSTLTQLEAQPGGPTAAQIDSVAKFVGGIDKAVGWIGDADVVVAHDGAGFTGGLVGPTQGGAGPNRASRPAAKPTPARRSPSSAPTSAS